MFPPIRARTLRFFAHGDSLSPMSGRRRHWVAGLLRAAVACTVVLVGGCQTGGPRSSGGSASIDRLVQVYPDLESGRFLIIADFEDARQMELFQLIGVSPHARCELAPKQGRRETGPTGLSFVSGSPNDTVVVSNSYANQWYLKRDWREYDLLLVSAFAPQPGLSLVLAVAGGSPADRLAAETDVPLASGWNVLRMDLAEMGEQIPIDDVQELRLSVAGASKVVELRLDDIILAGNRKDLLGNATARDAGLYVQRAGRRWKVGAGKAGGNFEITFANGQIVEWYNMATDPYRLHNLVRGETLGPNPVAIGSQDAGRAVAPRSRLIEASPVRVVIGTEWYLAGGRDGQVQEPYRRWTYTVYPTGQVYVLVQARRNEGDQLGLRAVLASAPGMPWHTEVTSPSVDSAAGHVPAFATARGGPAGAFLLYAIHGDRPARMNLSGIGRVELTASVDRSAQATERWAAHLFLASSDAVTEEEAEARARGYGAPVPCRLEVGAFVPATGDHSRVPGFEPGTGCHVLAPDQGLVRFVVDPSQHTAFSPVYKIISNPDREAWVYVDHLIHQPVARDADGNLLFQLPITLAKPTLVEVLFAHSPEFDGT